MDSTPPLSVDVTNPKNSHTRSPRLISCPQSDLFTILNRVNWVLYSNSINIYFLWLNLSVYNDGTRVMLRIHLTVTVSQLSLLLTIMIVVIVSQLTFLLAPPRQRTACPWKGFPDQNLKNSPSQICFEFCYLNISHLMRAITCSRMVALILRLRLSSSGMIFHPILPLKDFFIRKVTSFPVRSNTAAS